ncbi:MAG: AI-2E family transporter, partial [Niameybacter sp.]
NFSGVVIDVIATLILTFYFLKDKERLFAAIDRFGDVIFSPTIKRYVRVVVEDINEILGGFIVGTIFAGMIVGAISTGLMLMIGHPFAVLIGTVAGITNMIPYVGPLVGAVLALVLGLLDSVSLGVTGCILLLLYQQIDGNFIEPKVVGDKIGLPPVWILIVVIIGGSYYGGVGMILSAPVAALIKVYIDRAYEYKKKKRKWALEAHK